MSEQTIGVPDSWLEDFERDPIAAREMAAAGLAMETLSKLQDALSESGMSQLELSRTLGVTESAVSQVFNGDGNLRIHTFARYLRALGFEADLALKNVVNGAAWSTVSNQPSDRVAMSNPLILGDAIIEFIEENGFERIDAPSGLTDLLSKDSDESTAESTYPDDSKNARFVINKVEIPSKFIFSAQDFTTAA